MTRPTGPACGNNPNYRMSDGDRQAVEDFKAYLADRAALRNRIAEALHGDQTPAPVCPWAQELPLDREYFLRRADAVLAVLPPPADRAAVLREAADIAARFNSDCQNCAVELKVAAELRRVADEAQPAEALPPGGYVTRVCRHCWTGIRWVDGRWTHTDGRRGHTPEPPPLPAEPAAGARQDGADRG